MLTGLDPLTLPENVVGILFRESSRRGTLKKKWNPVSHLVMFTPLLLYTVAGPGSFFGGQTKL